VGYDLDFMHSWFVRLLVLRLGRFIAVLHDFDGYLCGRLWIYVLAVSCLEIGARLWMMELRLSDGDK
jgi:hypothetical protein